MTAEEKAAALKKLEYAGKANNGVVAAMGLQLILAAAGVSLSFPVSMILPLIAMQNSNYVKDILSMFGFLSASETDGAQFTFRWKIDPSGYVYDSVTGERLAGVTATAYYIADDGSDGFLDTAPEATEYGILWDAEEWDQHNPLTTDAMGRYAWDVPEGWWRVKFEKQGYETVWSDWLPVPPPQTNVNIGMVPSEAEAYRIELTDQTDTSASVSLTNCTGTSSSVRYILAAYDAEGRIAALGAAEKDLLTDSTTILTIHYPAGETKYLLKAFVLDSKTMVPLRDAWES